MKDVMERSPWWKCVRYILQNTWACLPVRWGFSVPPPMLIWQKTDWDITFKARGNEPAQVRYSACVCVTQRERERWDLAGMYPSLELSDWRLYLKLRSHFSILSASLRALLLSSVSLQSNQPAGSIPFRPLTAGGDLYRSRKLSCVYIFTQQKNNTEPVIDIFGSIRWKPKVWNTV